MIVWGGEDNVSAVSTGGRYALGLRNDADQDGVMVCQGDCDDTSSQVWAPPGEVTSLTLAPSTGADGSTHLTWIPPSASGSSAPLTFDTLRALAADGFSSAACLGTGGTATVASDAELPLSGSAFFYLVRARNACPSEGGSLGTDSTGTPRVAATCP